MIDRNKKKINVSSRTVRLVIRLVFLIPMFFAISCSNDDKPEEQTTAKQEISTKSITKKKLEEDLSKAEMNKINKNVEEIKSSNSNNCIVARDLWKKGNTEERIKIKIHYYEEAIALCPNAAVLHYFLGNAFKQDGQFEKAINEYNETLELDSMFLRAHINLAIIYGNIRKYDIAAENLQKCIELAEGSKEFVKEYDKARELMKEMIRDQAEYQEQVAIYNADLEKYVASISQEHYEVEKDGEEEGVKKLKVLLMSAGALLDYYGTVEDEETYAMLGKVSKLLSVLLYQEESEEGSGTRDPRMIVVAEFLSYLLPDAEKKGIVRQGAIPRYPGIEGFEELSKKIIAYYLDLDYIPSHGSNEINAMESSFADKEKAVYQNKYSIVDTDISGTWECLGPNWSKSCELDYGTQVITFSPASIKIDGDYVSIHRERRIYVKGISSELITTEAYKQTIDYESRGKKNGDFYDIKTTVTAYTEPYKRVNPIFS